MSNREKEIKEIANELQENKQLYELMKLAIEYTPEQVQTVTEILSA